MWNLVKTYNIDTLKFDAGESSWSPQVGPYLIIQVLNVLKVKGVACRRSHIYSMYTFFYVIFFQFLFTTSLGPRVHQKTLLTDLPTALLTGNRLTMIVGALD